MANAPAFELTAYKGQPWRALEAQHQIATRRLASSLRRQAILEQLLDAESKPAVPADAAHLHYLAATPFRYRPRHASRFRAAGRRGVWYGAGDVRTALTEAGFWRWHFWRQSPDSKFPEQAILLTAIRGRINTRALLDLTAPPLVSERCNWLEEAPYSHTVKLGAEAAAQGVQVIRYESLRMRQLHDREHALCYAVLSPAAFAGNGIALRSERNFALYLHPGGADVIASAGPERFSLAIAAATAAHPGE